jgi:hypothetical protein
MRWQALLVLLALALGIVGSPFLLTEPGYIDQAAFEYFGIERSTNPALSLCCEMPCLNQCAYKHLPLSLNNASEVVRPLFLSFLLAFQDERPPTS